MKTYLVFKIHDRLDKLDKVISHEEFDNVDAFIENISKTIWPEKHLLIFQIDDFNLQHHENICMEFMNNIEYEISNNIELISKLLEMFPNYCVCSFNEECKKYEIINIPFENISLIFPLTKIKAPLHECKFKFFDFEGKEVPYGEHLNFGFELTHKDIHPIEVRKIELPVLDYAGEGNPNITIHKYTFLNDEQRRKFLKI